MKPALPVSTVAAALGLALLSTAAMAVDFGPIDHPATAKECAACHMAYQAQFLPARSWTALMGDLGNHFGEDASLAPDVQADILNYLAANAADAPATTSRIRGLMRGMTDQDTPLRITEMPWWKRAHHEIGAAVYKRPQIKFAGNCIACHKAADQGVYQEEEEGD